MVFDNKPIFTIYGHLGFHISSFDQDFMNALGNCHGLVSIFGDFFHFASLIQYAIVYQNHHFSIRCVPSLWRIFPIHRISPKIMEYRLGEYFLYILCSDRIKVIFAARKILFFLLQCKTCTTPGYKRWHFSLPFPTVLCIASVVFSYCLPGWKCKRKLDSLIKEIGYYFARQTMEIGKISKNTFCHCALLSISIHTSWADNEQISTKYSDHFMITTENPIILARIYVEFTMGENYS